MFECWYDVLFMKCWVGFTPDLMGHTPSKMLNFVSSVHRIFAQKSWDNQYIFWQMWDEPLCTFGKQWIWLGNLPWIPFLPSLFLIVESWTLTLTEASEACSSGFFYESSLRSWSNFGRPASPGKVHHCSKFSPFMDNGSVHGSLDSQSFRNGSVAFFRLVHINYFVSHLFLNFFRSRHDVLLFKHASLWLVLFKWFLDSTGLSVIRPGCG